MPVTRATYARSVTYTVTERPDPATHGPDLPTRRRSGSWPSVKRRRRRSSVGTHAAAPDRAAVHAVDCTRCDVEMAVTPSATRGLSYLDCPKCGARFASTYEEVLAAGVGVRVRRDARPTADAADRWQAVRARAEAFHRRVDEDDPYRALDLPPNAPFAEVRARYHALAARHHPDHGGDAATMRRIIAAYARIASARRPQRSR